MTSIIAQAHAARRNRSLIASLTDPRDFEAPPGDLDAEGFAQLCLCVVPRDERGLARAAAFVRIDTEALADWLRSKGAW